VVRQLVKEVAALSFEVGVMFGHDLPLFFPVRRTVFFPRKVTLFAFQPFACVGQIERFGGQRQSSSKRDDAAGNPSRTSPTYAPERADR
jgi:hypothetical protein